MRSRAADNDFIAECGCWFITREVMRNLKILGPTAWCESHGGQQLVRRATMTDKIARVIPGYVRQPLPDVPEF